MNSISKNFRDLADKFGGVKNTSNFSKNVGNSSSSSGSPKGPEIDETLKTFLIGTVRPSCVLSKLQGKEALIRTIWEMACEDWWELHVERYPWTGKELIPELRAWEVENEAREPQYPRVRQLCGGCPAAIVAMNVVFPPLSAFSKEPLYCNMLPFDLFDIKSLPTRLQQYYPLVMDCMHLIRESRHQPNANRIGYLTVDERPMIVGQQSQRRAGLHVESPGILPVLGDTSQVDRDKLKQIQLRSGVYVPGAEHHWGGGMMMRRERVDGGIFMASNVSGTTAVWNAKVHDPDGSLIGAHGDIEFMRGVLGPCARTLDAGEMVWITDKTPHESLPVRAGAKRLPVPKFAGHKKRAEEASAQAEHEHLAHSADTYKNGDVVYRQYFRLVIGEVSAWFADHSDENPNGTVPPPSVRIVRGNKFELAEQMMPVRRAMWNTGSHSDCEKLKKRKELQELCYQHSLGHKFPHLLKVGIESVEELVQKGKKNLLYSSYHNNGPKESFIFEDWQDNYQDIPNFEIMLKEATEIVTALKASQKQQEAAKKKSDSLFSFAKKV